MSRSIMQDKALHACYICDHYCGDPSPKSYLEKHHVFGGPLRKKSEHFGLTVYLCKRHHTGDITGSKEAVHRPDCNDYALRLKKAAQKQFESQYGHEKFMKEFDRNWI